jgi:radical SAM superfamily enzyme YgiQ (UPF0313 family)
MYLSGYLKKNGIETKIIDIVLKEQIRDHNFYTTLDTFLKSIEDNMVQQVQAEETDIIGITCYTPEYSEVDNLARKIKAIKPNIKIIVGGIHPTFYPEDFLNSKSCFDYVVLGEGEITLLELVKNIRKKRLDFSKIDGVGFFDRLKNKVIITKSRRLHDNLDEIAYPDYDDIDMNFYTTVSPYAIRGVFTKSFYALSSRGCPGKCTFCVAKKLRNYHLGKRIRLRSPESLFHEITNLRDKYHIDSFYFIDDLFTMNKTNVHKLCDWMIKEKLPIIWGCSSRVNTIDFKLLKKMSRAGCVQIDFGVEKGSNRALKNLKKGITIEQINDVFSFCRSINIRTFANILINTPGETEKDLYDIILLLNRIKPTIVSVNIFTPYPGCEIYDNLCSNISKNEYHLLMKPATALLREIPERFRFSEHDIDIEHWAQVAMKKYNKALPNLKVYFSHKYWKSLINSDDKIGYIFQASNLIREYINQKK